MNPGKVYLVGAGPGDPDLLTLKALAVLQTADVVLHDDLVTREILSLARAARVESVGKRCGTKKISQEEIHDRMVGYARRGLVVARLKGGDPLIFGRAAEEIEALREAGIEFEIIPGVTAACSAAAVAQIPLTDRATAPHLIFVAGHRCGKRSAAFPKHLSPDTTLVVHMPGSDYAALSRELCESGVTASTPCLVVSSAAREDQEMRRTTLGRLPSISPLAPPAVLIAGNVAAAQTKVKTVKRRTAEKQVRIALGKNAKPARLESPLLPDEVGR